MVATKAVAGAHSKLAFRIALNSEDRKDKK
jgi:hypothetical protein